MDSQEVEHLRKRLKEEEQQREEAEKQREELRLQTQNTTLPEFLDACHRLGLDVQRDKHSSTKGDPTNVEQKLRPDYIREWATFSQEQCAIWKTLMDANFVT